MSIIVRDVSKNFGDFAALTNVSVEIPTGGLTALLGPSGGGKSTLLRVIAGLEEPDSGTVILDGQDLTASPARERGVGFVFQHYAAFKHLTVRRNIAFGLEIRKRPKAEITRRVDELLELVHTPPDLGLRALANLQPEGHVPKDAEVLERGVVLEDEADVAPLRWQGRGVPALDPHRPAVGLVEPSDDPEQTGLAPAARTEQGGQPAAGDVDADVVEGDEVAEPLVDVQCLDAHGRS